MKFLSMSHEYNKLKYHSGTYNITISLETGKNDSVKTKSWKDTD